MKAAIAQAETDLRQLAAKADHPDSFLQQAADLLPRWLDFLQVGFYTLDAIGEWAIYRAGTGELGRFLVGRGHKFSVNQEAFVVKAIRANHELIEHWEKPSPRQSVRPPFPDAGWEVAIPMHANEQVIGVCHILSATLDKAHIPALQAIVDNIGQEYSRLAQMKPVIAEAETVLRQLAAEAEHPDSFLQRAADLFPSQLGFRYAAFFMLDETGEWALYKAGTGKMGKLLLERGFKLSLDNSMVWEAIRWDREMIVRRESENLLKSSTRLFPFPEVQWAIVVPIHINEQVVGAFCGESITFDEGGIPGLQALVDEIGREYSRVKQMETGVAQAKLALRLLAAKADHPDSFLQEVADLLPDYLDCLYVSFFILDATGEWAFCRAGSGELGRVLLEHGHKFGVNEKAFVARAIRANHEVIFHHKPLLRSSLLLPFLDAEWDVAIPMRAAEQVIGAFQFLSMTFNEADIPALQALVDEIGRQYSRLSM